MANEEECREAIGRLRVVVPHLRAAAEEAVRRAAKGAEVRLAIIAENPDGSGQVGATFEAEGFLADLERLFPASQEALEEARAAALLGAIDGAR